MKKIIALALALIMVLSMGVVALAADEPTKGELLRAEVYADALDTVALYTEDLTEDDDVIAPGEKFVLLAYNNADGITKKDYKVSYDFTSAKYDFDGASMIASIAWEKNVEASKGTAPVYDLVLTIKENLTSITAKDIAGVVTLTHKTEKVENAETGKKEAVKEYILVEGTVNNVVDYVAGEKKAVDADPIDTAMLKNHVIFAEDGAGYVSFTDGNSLTATVKLAKDEKAQVYYLDQEATKVADADLVDAVEAYLGEDYDAIVEWYNFCGTGFGADVDFQYDAWEEDPHFFYAWDGEKFVAIDAKYDADEDVDNYVFTAAAKGLIIVTDVEIVAGAEETKNPDTGANDVVGVAAALAVVSLVAAGAVSLKK